MAIYRLLQNSPPGPEEISLLAIAYEEALDALDLTDRDDPITQLIAKHHQFSAALRISSAISPISKSRLLALASATEAARVVARRGANGAETNRLCGI
jgi:hypothetical protein